MKVYWWQGGLHLEPESRSEAEALDLVASNLHAVQINEGAATGPVLGNLCDQKPIVSVHERK